MQVKVEKVSTKEEETALIRVVEISPDISNAIDLLENGAGGISVSKDGKTYMCKTNAIYYIESVDKKSYVYTKDDCFDSKQRLYELEEMLDAYFVRCSKSMIINLRKVKNVSTELGSRMNATLLNGETVVISRSYVKEIKRRLEL